IVQEDGDGEANVVVQIGELFLQALVGGAVPQGRVLPDVVVVVEVAHSLIEELLLAGEGEGTGEIELLVVGAVGAFQVGVLLGVSLVILDQLAAEAGDELTQLLHLQPGLAAKLLTVVDGEGDGGVNAVAAEPGYGPEVEAEAVGPGLRAGGGDELEAGVDVKGAPLVVGDLVPVQVEDLVHGERLVVTDELEVDLDYLEGLGAVPVHKGPGRAPRLTARAGAGELATMAAQDMTDGGPGKL